MIRWAPSTRWVSRDSALRLFLVVALVVVRSKRLTSSALTWLRQRSKTPWASSREYQTSRFVIVANWAMASR